MVPGKAAGKSELQVSSFVEHLLSSLFVRAYQDSGPELGIQLERTLLPRLFAKHGKTCSPNGACNVLPPNASPVSPKRNERENRRNDGETG
jgi:hypothetical protein